MISPFGVEHGEVSKAFGMAAMGGAMGRKTAQAGQGMRRSGAGLMRQGRGMQANNPANSFKANRGIGMQRGGAARSQMGGQLRKLGQGMQKRPGMTGGIAAGGAAAGAGAAGGSMMNRRRF